MPRSPCEPLPLTVGRYTITADVRLDNRRELASALGIDWHATEVTSDSALLLAAYRRWGERCPEQLLGDFAFAIWDAQEQVLFCARDHFGVKQLYYYCSSSVFAFATEIKALLCLPDVTPSLNESRVADYLLLTFEDQAATLYRSIFRLPAAHCLTVGRDPAVNTRNYWRLDPSREVRLRSDDEYAEAFREIFVVAVRARLDGADRVGCLLSGGLDSSSIACVARDLVNQNGGRPLMTFSNIYDKLPTCDERRYINEVLKGGGFEPHYAHPDRLGPLSHWRDPNWYEDEPLASPQAATIWALCEAAQQQGIRILLDGSPGDFVVSHGFGYLSELARSGHWVKFGREAVGVARHFERPLWHIVRERGLKPLAPETLRRTWRAIRRRNRAGWAFQLPIRTDFARRIGRAGEIAGLDSERARRPRTARQQHYEELSSGAIPLGLSVGDAAFARYGIEFRFPFLDRRLVEFCLAIPSNQKIQNGWSRMIMRRALAGILPEEIRWRPGKANLTPAFDYGLRTYDAGIIEEILDTPGALADYLDIAALRSMYGRYLAKGAGEEGYSLWRAASMALWLRQRLAGREDASLGELVAI
jgi:asparagine synthase (glutamine-hydrolysing)